MRRTRSKFWTLSRLAPVLAALLATSSPSPSQISPRRPRATGSHRAFITASLKEAVRKGHDYLASTQDPNGYWSQDIGFKLNTDYRITARGAGHVGVTSLALMSFLAGGHLPGRGRYGRNIGRGLDYVLGCSKESGYIEDNGSRMYSHAFATLLLAEIYGMTRRRNVRRVLQQAVTVIVDSQNSEGGWRYKLFARESDMSITVCQVLALRSARNVGITVPATTIRQAEIYVKKSAVEAGRRNRAPRYDFGHHGIVNTGGAFRYQLRHGSRATFPLTAAGVTTLFAAGSYDNRLVPPALEYLREQMPRFNRHFGPDGHYFFYYGHYYAVQAFFVAGGNHWTWYFREMSRELQANQQRDGSWPCMIGPGEAFATAVATLILQIPYQYLPIFQR